MTSRDAVMTSRDVKGKIWCFLTLPYLRPDMGLPTTSCSSSLERSFQGTKNVLWALLLSTPIKPFLGGQSSKFPFFLNFEVFRAKYLLTGGR